MRVISDFFRKIFVGDVKSQTTPIISVQEPQPAPVVEVKVEAIPTKEEIQAEVDRVVNKTAKKPAAKRAKKAKKAE
jgi:hypothetical protein